MGYSETLEAAGAKVLAFQEFGSYQGNWYAVVDYNGEIGVAEGSYGSCSVCDAFEAEFGCGDEPPIEKDGKYFRNNWVDDEITKEEYDQLKSDYQTKFSNFGADYLRNISNKEMIKTRLDEITKKTEEDGYSFYEEEKEGLEWCLTQLQ